MDPAGPQFFTSTGDDGTLRLEAAAACSNWTDDSNYGVGYGSATRTTESWSWLGTDSSGDGWTVGGAGASDSSGSVNTTDGFESGDATRWS